MCLCVLRWSRFNLAVCDFIAERRQMVDGVHNIMLKLRHLNSSARLFSFHTAETYF